MKVTRMGDTPGPGATLTLSVADAEGWPTPTFDSPEDADTCPESLAGLLARHLAPSSVAVLIEVRFDGTRYAEASATAVNAEGDTRTLNLNQIYDLAAELAPPAVFIPVAAADR